jgi:hypothetical protein
LDVVRVHRIVFVEVEGNYIFKAKALFAVKSDKFAVYAQRA